jgi:hypothetical protein
MDLLEDVQKIMEKYNINVVYKGAYYDPEIDFQTVLERGIYGRACEHCGYGSGKYYIVRSKNDKYFFIYKWTGCLTYSKESGFYPAKTLYKLRRTINKECDYKILEEYIEGVHNLENIRDRLKQLLDDESNYVDENTLDLLGEVADLINELRNQ